MHCTFVAMGAENISLEVLSANLKLHGHTTSLAYDQALFDDKNYLSKPYVAKFFDHKDTVVGQVVQSKPAVVAFSVMTPTYTWALDLARRIKAEIDVIILFGGIHPTTCADAVIQEDCVDIVCKGEGDTAIVELCNGIDQGVLDTRIANLWFKVDGHIIRNEQASPIADLDSLPAPDKALFEDHVPISNSYLSVTSRGCPFACSFCSLSFYAEEAKTLGAKRLRERSVEHVINELKSNLLRYDYKWIEFRNNTFTASRRWVQEFCKRYKEEIGRPFLAFAHPNTMDHEVATWMRDAGCFQIQLGVESYDEWVREHILNRKETNESINSAVQAMDDVGLPYTLDYILGLPSQTEDELIKASHFFVERTACRRVSPYMLAYLPNLPIIDIGLKYGEISKEDVKRLESGSHDHYLATGSVGENQEKLRYFKSFRILYRIIPLLPKSVNKFIMKSKAYKIFPYLPVDFVLDLIDYAQILRPSDLLGRTYLKNYIWWYLSRFNSKRPAYYKNSIKNLDTRSIAEELRANRAKLIVVGKEETQEPALLNSA